MCMIIVRLNSPAIKRTAPLNIIVFSDFEYSVTALKGSIIRFLFVRSIYILIRRDYQ